MPNTQHIAFEVSQPDELDKVATAILDNPPPNRIITLRGDLGAGKTTLVQALCRQLGTEEIPSSPTFSIVNVYSVARPGGPKEEVYHIDLYRVKDLDEALELGLMEYLDSGCWCFIEWPEVAESVLPPNRLDLQLTVEPDGKRKILSL
ncbi:MAG: tRNA (adenosine(37)-N6)-threonylcarbamoyltransferase complex ATPase subunit type 1 TsaE [Saprospiraceae bacterium]|nr:MAG: tRNA (adenosine(37)-N6)-threonylcarbamoyltransferase complex ATPase subunit type 1 TsaE [Saprospiraceae bacterium]